MRTGQKRKTEEAANAVIAGLEHADVVSAVQETKNKKRAWCEKLEAPSA